eukprot:COSAG01_NODE_4406_length_5056_cov_124.577365_10_plen_93_part_00
MCQPCGTIHNHNQNSGSAEIYVLRDTDTHDVEQVLVDSGDAQTLALPPATMAALQSAIIAWFRDEPASSRPRACGAHDLETEQATSTTEWRT